MMKGRVGKQKYLREGIIRYKNSPVVIAAAGETSLALAPLRGFASGGEIKTFDVGLNDAGINVDPVPLGYTNVNRCSAHFLVRRSHRQWQQGLTSSSLMYHKGSGKLSKFPLLDYAGDIANTIEGIYPSFDEAVKLACLHRRPIAFHRNYAVSYKGELMFKGWVVGGVTGNREVSIMSMFRCLEAMCLEVLHEAA